MPPKKGLNKPKIKAEKIEKPNEAVSKLDNLLATTNEESDDEVDNVEVDKVANEVVDTKPAEEVKQTVEKIVEKTVENKEPESKTEPKANMEPKPEPKLEAKPKAKPIKKTRIVLPADSDSEEEIEIIAKSKHKPKKISKKQGTKIEDKPVEQPKQLEKQPDKPQEQMQEKPKQIDNNYFNDEFAKYKQSIEDLREQIKREAEEQRRKLDEERQLLEEERKKFAVKVEREKAELSNLHQIKTNGLMKFR